MRQLHGKTLEISVVVEWVAYHPHNLPSLPRDGQRRKLALLPTGGQLDTIKHACRSSMLAIRRSNARLNCIILRNIQKPSKSNVTFMADTA